MAAEPERAADLQAVWLGLPAAWGAATRGRSELTIVGGRTSDVASIYVYFLNTTAGDATNINLGRHRRIANGRIHVIDVYNLTGKEDPIAVVLHELGHVLGCCSGPETDGQHWTVCRDELMCPEGRTAMFSDRELRQMGLD